MHESVFDGLQRRTRSIVRIEPRINPSRFRVTIAKEEQLGWNRQSMFLRRLYFGPILRCQMQSTKPATIRPNTQFIQPPHHNLKNCIPDIVLDGQFPLDYHVGCVAPVVLQRDYSSVQRYRNYY